MKVLVSAGERSGDEHAARVVAALKSHIPGNFECRGMGGSALRNEGVRLLVDFETHGAVMGVGEVLKTLPRHLGELKILKDEIKNWSPDLVLLVDYAEFNSHLAKSAKRFNVPAYHFIPPQAWAWRERRVEAMKQNLIGAGVLFPFEEEFYHERGFLTAKFLGHPLVSEVSQSRNKDQIREILRIPNKSKVIALFPGSRKQEINRHISVFIETVNLLSKEIPNLVPIVAASKGLKDDAVPGSWIIHRGASIDVLKAADVGLIKSGTSNLQAALCGLPFAMIYKTSVISEIVGHLMLKIKQYSIVNLLIPGTVKEFVQRSAIPKNISMELYRLFKDNSYREDMMNRFSQLRSELSSGSFAPNETPQQRVASHIVELLKSAGRNIV